MMYGGGRELTVYSRGTNGNVGFLSSACRWGPGHEGWCGGVQDFN